MPNEDPVILDTSAILALRSDEAGANVVEKALRHAEKTNRPVLVSFMTRMELLYLIYRQEGELLARQAIGMLDTFNIEWVSCEPEILDQAALLKSHGGLSMADSWIAATAIIRGATLFHKDPELRRITEMRQQFIADNP
jgi:predicted nucleic acid-binding protein